MILTRGRVGLLALLLLCATAGLLVTTPVARSFGGDMLSQFRVKRLTAVSFDPAQLQALPDLSQIGTVTTVKQGRQLSVASAEEAGRLADMSVRAAAEDPALGSARFFVLEESAAAFRFDLPAARAHLAQIGHAEFAIPDRFHGATLTVELPPLVLAQYGGHGNRPRVGPDAMVGDVVFIAQGRSPRLRLDGNVTLAELRELLLSHPGLAPETKAQLRAIDDWMTALPIPVPLGIGVARDVSVNGSPGLALADNTGVGGVVLWTRNDFVFAVGGGRTAEDLLRIASALG
jgi:hypothetical protein